MSQTAVVRGCGTRVLAGIYRTTEFSSTGMPIEHFLYDPPRVIDPKTLGVTPVGVQLRQVEGVWCILDWIGSDSYPNVADFLEEARSYGVSRRLPRTLEFNKLGPNSMHILIHARGAIANYPASLRARADHTMPWQAERGPNQTDWRCPKQLVAVWPYTPEPVRLLATAVSRAHGGAPEVESMLPGHEHHMSEMCAGLWWEDVEGGTPVIEGERLVERRVGSTRYLAMPTPKFVEPRYKPALVARFPIHRLVVIRDGGSKAEKAALDAATRAGIDVEVEDA